MKTITIDTNSYNERRFGKPWIAKVDFTDPKGSFSFGDWSGDSRTGGEGTLSLSVSAGDIIATGQKDNRQPKNSVPTFFVVNDDLSIEELGDKVSAYKHYLAHKDSKPSKEELILEKENLLKRIAAIDELLA